MNIFWAAFFGLIVSVPKTPAITALLPMFRDNAHSPGIVKYGMHIIKQVNHVNHGQITVNDTMNRYPVCRKPSIMLVVEDLVNPFSDITSNFYTVDIKSDQVVCSKSCLYSAGIPATTR